VFGDGSWLFPRFDRRGTPIWLSLAICLSQPLSCKWAMRRRGSAMRLGLALCFRPVAFCVRKHSGGQQFTQPLRSLVCNCLLRNYSSMKECDSPHGTGQEWPSSRNEPKMFRSWKLGTAFGIGIYVHWTFLLLPAWVFLSNVGVGSLGLALYLVLLTV